MSRVCLSVISRSSVGGLNHLSLSFNLFSISSIDGSTAWISLGSGCCANSYLEIPIGALIRKYKIAFRNHQQVADDLHFPILQQVADDSPIKGNIGYKSGSGDSADSVPESTVYTLHLYVIIGSYLYFLLQVLYLFLVIVPYLSR